MYFFDFNSFNGFQFYVTLNLGPSDLGFGPETSSYDVCEGNSVNSLTKRHKNNCVDRKEDLTQDVPVPAR